MGSTYLFYTVRDSPSWRTEWVDWHRIDEPYNRKQPSLALDTTGTPHIGYGDTATSAVKYDDPERVYTAVGDRDGGFGQVAGGPPVAGAGRRGEPPDRLSRWRPRLRAEICTGRHPRPVIVAVPGGSGVPAGTDAAGVCDDVNGNGRKDFADVVLYLNQMTGSPRTNRSRRSTTTATAGSTSRT